jgi:hypothetical protein
MPEGGESVSPSLGTDQVVVNCLTGGGGTFFVTKIQELKSATFDRYIDRFLRPIALIIGY